MSKRFPIPAFDYERFKNMEWAPPKLLSPAEQEQKIGAARSGQGFGGYPVAADPKFYERFKLRGPNQHAVMCLLPKRDRTEDDFLDLLKRRLARRGETLILDPPEK